MCLHHALVQVYLSLSLWICATPFVLVFVSLALVCGVCLFEDRAFELVEGSYLVRPFQLWVRPIVAVMVSITRSLAFSCL